MVLVWYKNKKMSAKFWDLQGYIILDKSINDNIFYKAKYFSYLVS
jgi:hypothetical protein